MPSRKKERVYSSCVIATPTICLFSFWVTMSHLWVKPSFSSLLVYIWRYVIRLISETWGTVKTYVPFPHLKVIMFLLTLPHLPVVERGAERDADHHLCHWGLTTDGESSRFWEWGALECLLGPVSHTGRHPWLEWGEAGLAVSHLPTEGIQQGCTAALLLGWTGWKLLSHVQ